MDPEVAGSNPAPATLPPLRKKARTTEVNFKGCNTRRNIGVGIEIFEDINNWLYTVSVSSVNVDTTLAD